MFLDLHIYLDIIKDYFIVNSAFSNHVQNCMSKAIAVKATKFYTI